MRRRRSGDKLSATSNVPLARLKGHVYIEQRVLSIKSNHGDLLRGVRGLCILPPLKKEKKNPTLILNKAPRPSSKQISPRTQFRLVGELAPAEQDPGGLCIMRRSNGKAIGVFKSRLLQTCSRLINIHYSVGRRGHSDNKHCVSSYRQACSTKTFDFPEIIGASLSPLPSPHALLSRPALVNSSPGVALAIRLEQQEPHSWNEDLVENAISVRQHNGP